MPLSRARPPGVTVAIVTAVLALSWTAAARAHELWLAPSRYEARRGTTIEVDAVAGTGFRGERKPYSAAAAVRFTARAAHDLDLRRRAGDGELAWARLAPMDDGGAMLAWQSDFIPITVPASEFDAYLTQEGLDEPLAARRQARPPVPGRERFRRCAKTWLAGTDAARALRPFGLPLEIVPVEVPGAIPILHVRVLWGGRPVGGALLRAWRSPLDPAGAPRNPEERDSVDIAWQGRTGPRGDSVVPCAAPGEWLVSVVHMEASKDPSADWESTWASLAFARSAPSPRPGR
jgi:hypothetical protein